MSLRKLLQDPLFQRELRVGSGWRYPRDGWTYRGPGWFVASTLLPPILFWKLGTVDEAGFTWMQAFTFASLWQLWLISLRSILYTSVSMAYEIRENTLPVLRSTPRGAGFALFLKGLACVLPLWLELAVLLPCNLIFYSFIGLLPVGLILTTQGFLAATSVMFAGFGLWLGAVVGDPERAAGNARSIVTMLLFGTFLLERALTWPLLLVGALIWMCLVVQPQVRPGQAYQGGVAALVLLLLLPVVYTFAQSFLYHFELCAYNPLRSIAALAFAYVPTHSALSLSAEVWHLVPTGLGYLSIGLLFAVLTRSRIRCEY